MQTIRNQADPASFVDAGAATSKARKINHAHLGKLLENWEGK
jgi:hypothetical protein